MTDDIDQELASVASLQLEIAGSLERLRGNDELADSFCETANKLGEIHE